MTAAGHAHAEPPEQPLALADDLIAAVGGRPIAQGRVEALIATGTDATHTARLRVTDTIGTTRVELTGDALASDILEDRTDAGARIEHASARDRIDAYGAYSSEDVPALRRAFATDAHSALYGGAWTAWRGAGRFELQALGEQLELHDDFGVRSVSLTGTAQAARADFTSRRVQALDLDHELGAGIQLTRASGSVHEDLDPQMQHMPLPKVMRRTNSRFLRAYINDTIRVIESLDISGGFVFEHWRWLTSMPPLSQAAEEQMDIEAPTMIGYLLGPHLGALYRVTPDVAIAVSGYRRLRAPSWQQRTRAVQTGSVLIRPGDQLRPETVTGGELGPTLTLGRFEARGVAYYRAVGSPIAAVTVDDNLRETTNLGRAREAGVEAAATLRLGAPWLATATYAFTSTRVEDGGDHAELAGTELAHTPRHQATASLAYDEPRIVTLAAAVRYVGTRYEDDRNQAPLHAYTVIDAMASRTLMHGIAGFVSVENLLDRRFVAREGGIDVEGPPRLVQVGLRLDSARW